MRINSLATALALACTGMVGTQVHAQDEDAHHALRHVLLISIDGMHAVDYARCAADNTCPNLAALAHDGVNFTAANTSKPSDSFPGLMAIVTGGSPRTYGAYYDVSYDRVLAPPQKTTGNGVSGGACVPNMPNGTTTEYEEGIDLDQTKLNGGGVYSLMDGGIQSIDATRLPRDPYNNCAPVYPWNFIRTNTVYGVIHAAHGYTAWSDKHPAYAAVSGPGKNAGNLDDYYSPEINSTVIGLPGVTTATGMSCTNIVDPSQTGSWTDSFQNVQCYDTLKVNAMLNEINGKTHNGSKSAPVPSLFGMNFQAVSVGQKLIENNVGSGGYLDAAGTPSALLKNEIVFVDAGIGQMVSELKKNHLLDSTLVIITAKHGQNPIDPNRFVANMKTGTSPATLLANYLPYSESPANPNGIGPTEDDISLIWLANSSDTASAVSILEANGQPGTGAAIGQLFYGASLQTVFGKPGLPPNGDPRVPDIIVQPQTGVVYTGSSKKQEEHGGFAHDDTNVMLLVSNPMLSQKTVTTQVATAQVAPTILESLGLNPERLDAVRIEGTQVLPGIFVR